MWTKSVQRQTCEQFSRFLWIIVELSSDFPFDLKTGNMCVCVCVCYIVMIITATAIIRYYICIFSSNNRRGTWTMTNDKARAFEQPWVSGCIWSKRASGLKIVSHSSPDICSNVYILLWYECNACLYLHLAWDNCTYIHNIMMFVYI